ncbi:MAG: YoaK family protein [Solirubrobacterales bacterium]
MSPDSIRHPLTRALLVLTFATGVIDAVSFLGLGNVFTANMTGNVVLLGFGISGAPGLPILAPLVSLGSFFVGSVVGGRMANRYPAKANRLSRSMQVEIGFLAAAMVWTLVVDVEPGHLSAGIAIAMLAFALGVRNATVRQVKVADLTTTVLTMTLTALAADSPLAGGDGRGSWRRGGAVVAMLLGAIAGGLLVKAHLAAAIALAVVLAVLTWIVFVPAAASAEAESKPSAREAGS